MDLLHFTTVVAFKDSMKISLFLNAVSSFLFFFNLRLAFFFIHDGFNFS